MFPHVSILRNRQMTIIEKAKFCVLFNQLHVQRLVCMTVAPASQIHVLTYLVP